MIKLKPLIVEAFDERTIDRLLYSPYLPISYSISKKNDMVTKGKAVRVLGMRGFRKMIKQQNTKAIAPATQYWVNNWIIKTGVVGGYSTVSILQGDIIYRFRYDAAVSSEEWSGRKWINIGDAHGMKSGDEKAAADKVAGDILDLKEKAAKKYLKKYESKSHPLLQDMGLSDFVTPYKRDWEKEDWAEKFETKWEEAGKNHDYYKVKSGLIKVLIDALAKYEKSNYKDIQKIFSEPWGKNQGNYNEVEMTNFKIVKTYVKNKDFMKMLQDDFPKMKFIHEPDSDKISVLAKKDIKK